MTPIRSSGPFFLYIIWQNVCASKLTARRPGALETANTRSQYPHSQSWLQNRPGDSSTPAQPTPAPHCDSPRRLPQPTSAHYRNPCRRSPQPTSAPHRSPLRSLPQPMSTHTAVRQSPGNPPASLRCDSTAPTRSPQGSQPLHARPRQGFRKMAASHCRSARASRCAYPPMTRGRL